MVIVSRQRHRRARSNPTRRVGLICSWRNGQRTVTVDKARTARLSVKVPPAEDKSGCRSRRGGSDLAPARCPHGSRAVRALSAV